MARTELHVRAIHVDFWHMGQHLPSCYSKSGNVVDSRIGDAGGWESGSCEGERRDEAFSK